MSLGLFGLPRLPLPWEQVVVKPFEVLYGVVVNDHTTPPPQPALPPDALAIAMSGLPPRTVNQPSYTGDDFLGLLRAASRDGGLDCEEWRRLRRWTAERTHEITPELERMFAELDRLYQDFAPPPFIFPTLPGLDGTSLLDKQGTLLAGTALETTLAALATIAGGAAGPLPANRGSSSVYLELTVEHLLPAEATITVADASVERALGALMDKRSVSAFDFLQVLRAAADYDQLTEREWSQIGAWVEQNRARLSPDAQRMFDETAALVSGRVPQFAPGRGPVLLGGSDGGLLAAHMTRMTAIAVPPQITLPRPPAHPLENASDAGSFASGGLVQHPGWIG
jgi:hypothetical protein